MWRFHICLNPVNERDFFHHRALFVAPVSSPGEETNRNPFVQSRKVAGLLPGLPNNYQLSQSQFGPTSPGLPLLAGQPLPERRDEVVVRQLITLAVRLGPPPIPGSPPALGV